MPHGLWDYGQGLFCTVSDAAHPGSTPQPVRAMLIAKNTRTIATAHGRGHSYRCLALIALAAGFNHVGQLIQPVE